MAEMSLTKWRMNVRKNNETVLYYDYRKKLLETNPKLSFQPSNCKL